MTQNGNGHLSAETIQEAGDLAAFPLLIIDESGEVLWANYAAEEWMGTSLKSLRRGPLRKVSKYGGVVTDIAAQCRKEEGNVVAVEHAAADRESYDIHARWSPDKCFVTISVLPRRMPASGQGDAARGFARMLAHELKNPLASIRGAAQLIQREDDLAECRGLAVHIIDDADRMTRLTNHWSRMGEVEMTQTGAVNLNELGMAALERLHRARKLDHIEIVKAFDPSLPDAVGDEDLLLQLVLNLLDNAADALTSQQGARITIETRYDASHRSRASSVYSPLLLSVTDTGPGIPEALQPNLFTPFVTTKANGEGLGLAFAARVAEMHSGQLDYDSESGRTRFNLRLPVFKEEMAR
ncbi:two-component system sensor histidine kinase NtrB [Maricaulis sp. D1M11]|uniref:two-component system sensor histidine kinase NtrB n=1 Tax=Maricaulis sp. D1M11 TaxID=3076117 RepID=UPI0039B69E60